MPKLREVIEPKDELELLIREATQSVENDLNLEDEGWINLSTVTSEIFTDDQRISNLKWSRIRFTKDPLARQAIRLWTDYTFGSGMTWQTENEQVNKVLEGFWNSKANQCIFSARGQRKSSDKLLVDGEIFFAIFLGSDGEAKIRHIDPLEITEIITDPDDIENIRFYKRAWIDRQGTAHEDYYRSTINLENKSTLDSSGKSVEKSEDALVYHLSCNTITQRGNPLLLPALDWIKYYRKFLASRIAIMLALAKFAWKQKVKGGQAAVNAIKAKLHEETPNAGSTAVENEGVDTTPIKTDTGAQGAYQDGRQIKLQIAAAVGIPEQYFGDISIGNLATAKTVELPMMKMFQSYQKVWADAYQDIDEIVLAHNQIPPDKWYVDRDFPPIAPEDVAQMGQSLSLILQQLPELAYSDDVKQMALMVLGINDPKEVLDALNKESKGNPEVALTRELKRFRESLKKKEQ